jgi:hypothetical protein
VRFRFTGAHPEDLASGRSVAFGDVVELSRREKAANARLIDEGRLQPIPRRRSSRKPKTQESDK